MQIDDKLIGRLGDITRLALSPDEKKLLAADLAGIMRGMERLDGLGGDGIESAQMPGFANAFRDDEPRPSLSRDLALKNAPAENGEMFIAPITVE